MERYISRSTTKTLFSLVFLKVLSSKKTSSNHYNQIAVLACVGYADLNITEHHYKDILLKEINGELICTNTSVDPRKLLPRNRRAGFLPSSRHYQQEVLNWNCSYAARLLSTCYDSYAAPQDLGTNPLSSVPDPQRIKACETAVSLKKSVDGSMIFLIIIFSSLLNTIVQSTIPIFKGKMHTV